MENEKLDPLEEPIPDGESLEKEFDDLDRAAEEEADRIGASFEEKMEAMGEELEEKADRFGEILEEKAEEFGKKMEETFDGAFSEFDKIEHEIEQEKAEVHSAGRGQSIFWGFVLIAVGAILILQRTGLLGANFNWWALFIFIPAVGALSTSWNILLKKRRITGGVRSSFGSFVVIGTLATILLLGLNWRIWWPLMLIAPGFSIFLGGFIDRKSKAGSAEKWLVRSGWWVGLSMMGLGAAFILQNLDLYSMAELIGFRHWWAFFLILPGITFLVHALITIILTHRFPFAAVMLIGGGISALAVSTVALLEFDWSLIPALVAVGAGIMIIFGEFLRKVIHPKQVKSVTIETRETESSYQK